MNWQPMSTAPTDGREVWVTFQWAGRLVGSDSYPYLDDAIAWREIVPGEEQPEPYAAPLKFVAAGIMPVDPRDAEIERLRAKVDLLSALMPTDNELEQIECTTSKNYEYADNDVINGWVARVAAVKESLR